MRVRPSSLGKYVDRVGRITAWLGDVRIGSLRVEQVATWQAELLDLAGRHDGGRHASRVPIDRRRGRQPWPRRHEPRRCASRPPKSTPTTRRALTASEARRLSARPPRIAWAPPSRCSSSRAGGCRRCWDRVVGPRPRRRGGHGDREPGQRLRRRSRDDARAPEDRGRQGSYLLAPVVVEFLRRRRRLQDEDRLRACEAWQRLVYGGRPIDLVFTTATGGPACARPSPRRWPRRRWPPAWIRLGWGRTSAGRRHHRALRQEGLLDLADVARHVGTPSPATTAGYVRHLGRRPQATADAAEPAARPDPAGVGRTARK